MTPEKCEIKASELVEHFAETIPPVIYGSLIERDWETAKKCALIAAEFAFKVIDSVDMSKPMYEALMGKQFGLLRIKKELESIK